MTLVAYLIVAAVALQRLVEVFWAERNMRRLKARGATEVGARHYPLIVLLHVAWLAAMVVFLPRPAAIHLLPLLAFLLLEAGRVWVLMTLGAYFTTRIVTLPGTALVRTGPYRFVRHPNYLVVCGEIFVLPLVFGEWDIAIIFSILNAMILAWRIRTEDEALAPRRSVQ
jgi:methyltransferase